MKKFIQDLIELGADFSTKKALKRSLKLVGLRPENVDRLYVEFKNDHYRDKFRSIVPKDKILFLPQCLRRPNCKATLDESGYHCVTCSPECKVQTIKARAESLGYRVFICPGGSMIAKILAKHRPKAVMGVACIKEIIMAGEEAEQTRLPYQAIELLKNGCVNTDVDLEEVFRCL